MASFLIATTVPGPPSSAPFTASSSGNNLLVPAAAGKKILLIGIVVSSGGLPNSVRLVSGRGTFLTGPLDLTSSQQLVLPVSENGWLVTNSSEELNLNLSTASTVGGVIVYREVD